MASATWPNGGGDVVPWPDPPRGPVHCFECGDVVPGVPFAVRYGHYLCEPCRKAA